MKTKVNVTPEEILDDEISCAFKRFLGYFTEEICDDIELIKALKEVIYQEQQEIKHAAQEYARECVYFYRDLSKNFFISKYKNDFLKTLEF